MATQPVATAQFPQQRARGHAALPCSQQLRSRGATAAALLVLLTLLAHLWCTESASLPAKTHRALEIAAYCHALRGHHNSHSAHQQRQRQGQRAWEHAALVGRRQLHQSSPQPQPGWLYVELQLQYTFDSQSAYLNSFTNVDLLRSGSVVAVAKALGVDGAYVSAAPLTDAVNSPTTLSRVVTVTAWYDPAAYSRQAVENSALALAQDPGQVPASLWTTDFTTLQTKPPLVTVASTPPVAPPPVPPLPPAPPLPSPLPPPSPSPPPTSPSSPPLPSSPSVPSPLTSLTPSPEQPSPSPMPATSSPGVPGAGSSITQAPPSPTLADANVGNRNGSNLQAGSSNAVNSSKAAVATIVAAVMVPVAVVAAMAVFVLMRLRAQRRHEVMAQLMKAAVVLSSPGERAPTLASLTASMSGVRTSKYFVVEHRAGASGLPSITSPRG